MTEEKDMDSFWRACMSLDYDAITLALKEQKINPNQRDRYGHTPLGLVSNRVYQSSKKALKCAQALLLNGANVTFLQEGSGFGRASAIDLIDIGEVRDKKGYREYFKFLLEHGCPITNYWRYHVEESELGQNGISKVEIHSWEKVGEAYLEAKKRGIEIDFDHPEEAMKALGLKEELEVWRDLPWKTVSSNVINKMIKGGRKVDERLESWEKFNYTTVWYPEGDEWDEDTNYKEYRDEHSVRKIISDSTPLHKACQAGNLEAIKALIQAGANPNAEEYLYRYQLRAGEPPVENGYLIKFPIDYAQNMEVATYLIQHGAKVSREQISELADSIGKSQKETIVKHLQDCLLMATSGSKQGKSKLTGMLEAASKGKRSPQKGKLPPVNGGNDGM